MVVRREARVLGPRSTEGSYTITLMKEVPKYIKVPAMAATLALEKKDWRKTASPKSDKPYISKKRKTRPLFEYLIALMLKTPIQRPLIMVTMMK